MKVTFHVGTNPSLVRVVAPSVIFVFVFVAPAQADFMFFHGGHSYLTVTTPAAWANAAGDAASRQFAGAVGQLARIDDQAENDAILAALLANIPAGDFINTVSFDGGGGSFVWIGATDRQMEGQWIWDGDADGAGDQFWQGDFFSGFPVGGRFHNWGIDNNGDRAEPDDFFMAQDATGISLNGWPQGAPPGVYLGVAGQWNDVDEINALYYLVEFDAVPEPAAPVLLLLGSLAALCLRRIRRHV